MAVNRARNNNGRVGGAMNGGMNGRTNTGMNGGVNWGMNGNVNGNMNGGRLDGDLAEQVRALTFVKKELELYLDTHPDCHIALDYYYRTMQELKRLTEDYENRVGPLTSAGVLDPNRWTWVNQPWPWQRDGDYMQPREDR